MAPPIKLSEEKPQEGALLMRYTEQRVIKRNKNLLVVFTGPTGSGKSYGSLRFAELWYNYRFKKPFPEKHICFSVYEVMNLLNKGELKRGDVIILEEAGANMGALDFQNKVSKIFSYVLQAFRSMNLILIMNLPYLSMLNKTARMLLHVNFLTYDIDKERKVARYKVYFHQVNQQSGVIYTKNMRVRVNNASRKIRLFELGHPSKELTEQYENKKKNFLGDMVGDFIEEIAQEYEKKLRKNREKPVELTEKEKEAWVLYEQGYTYKQIAEKKNYHFTRAGQLVRSARKKLKEANSLEK